MKEKELVNILESIKNLTETSKSWEIRSKDQAIIFGELDGPSADKFLIVVKGRKNIIEFKGLIQKLWKKETEFFNNLTYKTLESGIVKLLRENIEEASSFKKSDFENLKADLLSRKAKSFEIFKELKGCKIESEKPISLNGYNFYCWPEHSKFLKGSYREAFDNDEIYFYNPDDNKTLISTTIQANEFSRANELADNQFKKIESILRFLLTDTSHSNNECNLHDVGIFDFREQNWLKSVSVTKDSIAGLSKITGTYKDIILTEDVLLEEPIAKRIWDIFSKPKPSKIEVKIMNSIEWIGKAKHEIDNEKSFIQYLFSIESLMNFSEQGIISPSLSYQMCEYISFLLGNSENERLELDKTFRYLYGIRSAIVHGSSKEFTDYDLEDAKNMAEKLVTEFLTQEYLYTISSKDNYKELKDLIKKRKYASS